jgi:hypothetical protein
MKKVIAMVVLGIGGLAVAIGLTVGALALAGDVGTVVQPRLTHTASPSDVPSPSREDDDDRSGTPSPSVDDHGGVGSDDPAGSDDDPGSGSDNSGSGSDDSGSGSDDSDSHDDD